MLKILRHFFKFLFINPDKLEKIHKEILSVIRAKDKQDNNENQCKCTCDECGTECEPFWKKEQTNEK